MAQEPKPQTARAGLAAINAKIASEVPGYAAGLAQAHAAKDRAQAIRAKMREHRKAAKIDQGVVANRLGVTQSAVSKIENATGDIGLLTLLRYAEAIGMDLHIDIAPAEEAHAAVQQTAPKQPQQKSLFRELPMHAREMESDKLLARVQAMEQLIFSGGHQTYEAPFVTSLGESKPTEIERNCLLLAGAGKDSTEIGRMLQIPPADVCTHIASAAQKLTTSPAQQLHSFAWAGKIWPFEGGANALTLDVKNDPATYTGKITVAEPAKSSTAEPPTVIFNVPRPR